MADHGFTPAQIDWTPDEPPRSRVYGDLYFSRDDGLEESRAVFLEGCGLPNGWADRRHFTVAELGFGSGLNIVALLDLWRRDRPANGHLHIFSIEAHPLTAEEAARALSAWPEVAETSDLLLARWPRPTRGFHRVALELIGATLDVAVMDVGQALGSWNGAADAWFLDGFAPALNPAMWRREVIDLVAARSSPGARIATYTVAGSVRRDLAEAGFQVERKPGFGRKRERLEARLPGGETASFPTPRVAIVGGGIAAASLSRAFASLGVEARVYAGPAEAPSASAGPAALVAPRLDAGLGPPAALFAQAFHRACDLYEALPSCIIARGALQLPAGPDDHRRFAKIVAGDLFDPTHARLVDRNESATLLGEPVGEGLLFDDAVVVDPAVILRAWLDGAARDRVASIRHGADGWRLSLDSGVEAEADVVVVAAGFASERLLPALGLGAVRGQASWAAHRPPALAALGDGYAIPTRDGVMFGATHDRGDTGIDERDGDHVRNLASIRKMLPIAAERLCGRPLVAHVGTRATTKDFMPLAGAVEAAPPGLFVLTGLGSRGYCLAPLLAEHVASVVLGLPSPVPREGAALVEPGRFARREARSRGRAKRLSSST